MSSREIAELTGKRHDNVMADIKRMLVELGEGLLKFQGTYVNAQNGQTYPCFNLPKRETLILVSGYSVVLRSRIIDRWQELEAQAAPALPTSTTLPKQPELGPSSTRRRRSLGLTLCEFKKATIQGREFFHDCPFITIAWVPVQLSTIA